MKHDPFDFFASGMTHAQRAWRIALLIALVIVLGLDIYFWRP
jgi:hypothetical protein